MKNKSASRRRKFTAVDFFCGAGGLSEGFRQAGFSILAGNDIDRYAAQTYKSNHPDAYFIKEDIARVTADQFLDFASKKCCSEIDVAIGSPPCKGFSIENMKTKTVDNPQNSLFYNFVRLVRDIKPKFFVMENVPGFLYLAKGTIAEEAVKSFKKVGYSVWYHILNAVDYGAPQVRKRVFFIGNRLGIITTCPESSHTPKKRGTVTGLKPYVTVKEAIGDLPLIIGEIGENEMDYTASPQTEYQKIMRKGSKKIYNHITTKNTPIVVERFKHIPEGGNWKNIPKDLMQCNSWYKNIEKTHSLIYRRMRWDAPSTTLANFRKAMLVHPEQHRLFTVREAARLQSFPDRYIFKGGLSAMQQQVSDAVPVFLAKAVGENIKKYLVTHCRGR